MDYDWSDSSALDQVEHGEPGTARTQSAYVYLEVSLNGGDIDTVRAIGLRVLGILENR